MMVKVISVFDPFLGNVSILHQLKHYQRFSGVFRVTEWEPLRKKCPYLELFWSAFSRIRSEYGEIRSWLWKLKDLLFWTIHRIGKRKIYIDIENTLNSSKMMLFVAYKRLNETSSTYDEHSF